MVELSKELKVEEPYCRLNARMLLNRDPKANPIEKIEVEKLEQVLLDAKENGDSVLDKFPHEYYDDLVKPAWINLTQAESDLIITKLKLESIGISEFKDAKVSFKGTSFIVSLTLYHCG